MALIGQIIYNVQDYLHRGGYVSTVKGSLSNTVVSNDLGKLLDNKGEPTIDSGRINIYENILSNYSNIQLLFKLGVLAPPGTRLILNKSKEILIGLNGIYELDDDIAITEISFIQPQLYERDNVASGDLMKAGLDLMQTAESTREEEMAIWNKRTAYTNGEIEEEEGLEKWSSDTEKWTKYTEILESYIQDYNAGQLLFLQGLEGVYNPRGKLELYNVIIDFIYEEKGGNNL